MTTGQILILVIASLLMLITMSIGMIGRSGVGNMVLLLFAMMSLMVLDVIIISYVSEANKKPISPSTDRYEQVVIPSDTLYRKIK